MRGVLALLWFGFAVLAVLAPVLALPTALALIIPTLAHEVVSG